jgi:hypothetical protein
LFAVTRILNRQPELSLSPDGKTLLYESADRVPPAYVTIDVAKIVNGKN